MKSKLAVDRTNLAVDRTILAYLRTSLTIIVVGVSFIKLFNGPFLSFIGWILIVFSFFLFIFGIKRCNKLKKDY
jgi:putative membrane protein